jgi:hypothetical protein
MINNINPQINQSNNTINSQSPNGITATPVSFRSGRVKNIILDESNEKFKQFGEWNALGIIEYQDITNPNSNTAIAKPYFGNIKNYPLIDEIVWIVTLPSNTLNGISRSGVLTKGFTTNVDDYYIVPASLWNHPHHNAFPSSPNQLPESQRKDYLQTQIGNVRKVTDQSTEINLGNTFIERPNIHPLKPFEGDIIHEGRWGNSIRLGSTIKTKPPTIASLNNWSTGNSISGDPIIVLRNGQGKQNDEGWIPVVEEINNDESSLYLTSTQKIPLKASSTNYSSYKNNPPINPGLYEGKQVIINSGRLVFNSSNDHILLSSNKSINLNSQNGLNIDTNVVTFQTKNIYLGAKNATEPLLLGNKTVTLLKELIVNLKAFMQVAASQVSTPTGTPLGPLNMAASQMQLILENIDADLSSSEGDIRSKNNFTT